MDDFLRLRWRILGPALAAIGLVLLVTGWIGAEGLRQHFRGLEKEESQRSQRQASNALDLQLSTLATTGLDWSHWDDPYRWLGGAAPEFPATNLVPSTLTNLKLAALGYFDNSGGTRGCLGAASDTGVFQVLRSRMHGVPGASPGWTGVVAAGDRLYLATVQPVLPSDGSGLRRGWLAMVRPTGPALDSALSAQMQSPLRLLARGAAQDHDSWDATSDSGILRWSVATSKEDPAWLELRCARPIQAIGQKSIRTFLLRLLLGLSAGILLSLAILDQRVIARIARLSAGVDKIRQGGGAGPSVVDPIPDELGVLSRSIEEMVEAARRSREELQVALDRAETAHRARVNFLQSMTHELRTPLNGVIGLTEMALKGRLEPDVQEGLELSRNAALGLLETINGVLEFSRLERDEVELVWEEIDPQEVLLDAARVVGAEADRRGLEFLFLAQPSLPERMEVDPARLRRIFVNLAGNAVKYTLSGKVVVDLRTENDSLVVAIRDTGIGIAPQRQQAIFEAFEQADEESAIRFGGTGLGLTVARALARALGGDISCQSEPGIGSTFCLSIPLRARSGARALPMPMGGVQLALVRPELGDLLQSGFGSSCHKGAGTVVTDSLERAVSMPQRCVLLCRSGDLKRARAILDDGRVEILAWPFTLNQVAQALLRCERAEATIAILCGGRILPGLLVSQLEKGGYRTVSPSSEEELSQILADGVAKAAVVDLDDDQWGPMASSISLPVLALGDPEEHQSHPHSLRKPVRSSDLLEAIAALLVRGA